MSTQDSTRQTLEQSLQSVHELTRSSWTSILLMFLGGAIVVASFAYSVTRLRPLEDQVHERETEVQKLEGRAKDLQGDLNSAAQEIDRMQRELTSLRGEKSDLEGQVKELQATVGDLTPTSLTIFTASDNQQKQAEQIKQWFAQRGVKTISIQRRAKPDAPYTTEVRYFNYPADIELAQSICLRIQKDLGMIMSRISLVRDNRPKGTIEIHFQK